MSKQAEAWMPLYVGDYLGDTQRLTTEQHGAYLLLILDYWRNGPAPDDDAVLQQITRLERAAWKRHRNALAKLFQIVEGEWRHKRIDRELEAAKANQERRSSKAKTAAQARWGDAKSNAPSMPGALLEECPPPSPSPEPIGSSSEAKASSPRAAKPDVFPRPDFADPQAWADLLVNRKAKRLPNTASAHRKLLADIERHSSDAWPPGRLIEHAAAKGWGGIYDPTGQDNRNDRPAQSHPERQGIGRTTAAALSVFGGMDDGQPPSFDGPPRRLRLA